MRSHVERSARDCAGAKDAPSLDSWTRLRSSTWSRSSKPAGRGEAARAGRLLLHLERLSGYGFLVDVAAVGEVDLEDKGEEEEEEEEEEERPLCLLRRLAKHALCSCVTGEGEPPLALLLGAIACAGSGEI